MTDLSKFCDPDHRILNRPWSAGDYTYASNGVIIVRIPRQADVAKNIHIFDASPCFVEHTDDMVWHPVIGYKKPDQIECDMCDGHGMDFVCPECDGHGEVHFENDFHTYDCDCNNCDGTGKIEICPECEGTGKADPTIVRAWFHEASFNQAFLALLSDLPNCEMGMTGVANLHPFRFDGGDGAIMPLRD